MFVRKPLRDEVQLEILSRIWDGRLPGGKRINETRLSADLGLSRTPLREAMIYLAGAGFLDSDLGRGFKVPPLDPTEFRHIQEMLVLLAPAAVAGGLQPEPPQLMELSNLLGRARIQGDTPHGFGELVWRWSGLAVRICSNPRLVQDVQRLETMARRYWQATAANGLDTTAVIASLAEIYEDLRSGRMTEAGETWRRHIVRFTAEAVRILTDPVATER